MEPSTSRAMRSYRRVNRKYHRVFRSLKDDYGYSFTYRGVRHGRYSENFNQLDKIVLILCLVTLIAALMGVL